MSGCRFNWRFLLGHHYAQYALHTHNVTASLPSMEKVTGALPLPFVIFDGVMVIVATESQCKTLKRYALPAPPRTFAPFRSCQSCSSASLTLLLNPCYGRK